MTHTPKHSHVLESLKSSVEGRASCLSEPVPHFFAWIHNLIIFSCLLCIPVTKRHCSVSGSCECNSQAGSLRNYLFLFRLYFPVCQLDGRAPSPGWSHKTVRVRSLRAMWRGDTHLPRTSALEGYVRNKALFDQTRGILELFVIESSIIFANILIFLSL